MICPYSYAGTLDLNKDIYDFIVIYLKENDCPSNWSKQYLPTISDNSLMFRLWLPKSSNNMDLPVLTLARTVYTTNQADNEFYERIKSTAKDVSKKHQYDVIDLSEWRTEKLYKVLAQKSGGDFEKIDDEMVASSFKELLQIETAMDKDTIKKLSDENNWLSKSIDEIKQVKDNELIAAYSQKYIDRLGMNYILILTAKYWWLVSAVLIASITLGINYLTAKFFNSSSYLPYIIVIVPFLLKIIDKLSSQKFFVKFIENKLINKAKGNYINRIKEKLTPIERGFECAIIDYCIQRSKVFNQQKIESPTTAAGL